jgi:hypothetical protein
MILQGNIRAGGQELATHLLNDRHEVNPDQARQSPKLGNEKVLVSEVRGFLTDDLRGAFAEAEAIAKGTRCKKPLYSLSINPSQVMSREEYGQAFNKIERALGLENQPRAIVYHVKNGREHAHVVWSRIDNETMKTRSNAFDRQKLREVARELVRDFGHPMPKHLAEDRGKDRFNAVSQPTLAEQGQQARSGISPEERRETVTEAYRLSDNAKTFRNALLERGYALARGDKRGFVVVDKAGEVHSLTRQIENAKAKEIEQKLTLKKQGDLPSVQEAKELMASMERQKAEIATQERPDTPDRVEIAQEALTALREAQQAEIKALKGAYHNNIADIRKDQAERLKFTAQAVKQAYKPDWADMYKRHRAEVREVKEATKTMGRRLGAVLSGKAKELDERAGTLSGAFNFVVRGGADLVKLEKLHKEQKADLGKQQRQAQAEENKAIKQESQARRAEARDGHKAKMLEMKTAHKDELTKAIKNLETAREMTEQQGRDLSRGAVTERKAPTAQRAQGFGFAKQGFDKQGMGFGGFGREDDQEREDEGREIPPPGQSFTPN